MSEVCSIVCTFLHVQSTDYIHTYRHHFLFVLFLPLLINQTQRERERERERPLVKSDIVERSGPKVSDSGSRSPAERSLSGNLNTNSFFNDFTEYDLRLSLPPPLPFWLAPRIGVFRSVYSISLSLSLSVSLCFSILIFAVSVPLCSCVFLLLSLAHMSYHIYTKQI